MLRPSRIVSAGVFAVSAFTVAVLVGDLPRLPAQPKPGAPVIPPEYPTLTTPASLAAKRGGPAELVLTGTKLTDVTGVWTSFGGKVTIPDGQKDATKLKVTIDVPAATSLGLHTIRLATKTGVSNLRPFIVDELADIPEVGTNKIKTTPQVVPVPCVVSAKAESEAGDFFKFPVSAGQPITIEVIGRRLGSPIDPVILLYDGTGKELGGVYADDTPGLQTDSRVIYTPKTSGDLIAEVRDTTYRGGADYVYRLRIGNFPGATTAFPLAIERGKSAAIGFAGPGLDGVKPVTVTAPTDPSAQAVYVAPKRADGLSGWPVPVDVNDFPEAVEQEPNNDATKANKLPVPGGISARFGEKNDGDFFAITGKKGQKLTVQAKTFELNAPTEVYLRVLDAKGAELAKSNPQQAGAKVEFTPSADGEYRIACEHLNYASGPSEVYHLSVVPAAPDFSVTVGLDRFDVPFGGVGVLPIIGVTRTNGFAGPIDVTFVGGTGLSGTLTIPPGANPQPATPLFLAVSTKPGTPLGPVVGYVRATAKIDGKDVVRAASLLDSAKAALGNIPTPPPETTVQVAAAIVPEAPFSLAVKLEKPEVAKGGTIKGTVTAKRADKFAEEIALVAIGIPANVTAKLKPIAKGTTTAEFELTPTATAPDGPWELVLRGTAKVGKQDVSAIAVPVPFTVTEPAKKEVPKKK